MQKFHSLLVVLCLWTQSCSGLFHFRHRQHHEDSGRPSSSSSAGSVRVPFVGLRPAIILPPPNDTLEHARCYKQAMFRNVEERIQSCKECYKQRQTATSSDDDDYENNVSTKSESCDPKPASMNELFAAKYCTAFNNGYLYNFHSCWSCLKNERQISVHHSHDNDAAQQLWKKCIFPHIQSDLNRTCNSFQGFRYVRVGNTYQLQTNFEVSACRRCIDRKLQDASFESKVDVRAIKKECTTPMREKLVNKCSKYVLNATRTECAVCVSKFDFTGSNAIYAMIPDIMPCFRLDDVFQRVHMECKSGLNRRDISNATFEQCASCARRLADDPQTRDLTTSNFTVLRSVCYPHSFYDYGKITIKYLAEKYDTSFEHIEQCLFNYRHRVLGSLKALRQYYTDCFGSVSHRAEGLSKHYCTPGRTQDPAQCKECIRSKIMNEEVEYKSVSEFESLAMTCSSNSSHSILHRPFYLHRGFHFAHLSTSAVRTL